MTVTMWLTIVNIILLGKAKLKQKIQVDFKMLQRLARPGTPSQCFFRKGCIHLTSSSKDRRIVRNMAKRPDSNSGTAAELFGALRSL